MKKMDGFSRNILIVFAGTTLVNIFNFLYQLLIAHRLSPTDFATFNSLLSIFMLLSSPLGTLQMAVTKYVSGFNAQKATGKVRFLLSDLFRKSAVLSAITLLIFWFACAPLLKFLKIPSLSSGYLLALLLASAWLAPVFAGGVQGLELFGWLASSTVISGGLKLGLASIFIILGFNIAGALGALLASNVIIFILLYFPLRGYLTLNPKIEEVNYKEILWYLFPVAISYFCFTALVSFDIVMVKYYFSAQDSGLYSLAQMIGKVFFFLPGAISIVMFPRTSGLKAKNMDTVSTLEKSLLYVFILSAAAIVFYNIFPGFVLKVMTGKVYETSIFLGRIFSVSMSFFALLFILISYFLSIKDLRFIPYLVFFTVLQFVAIGIFHQNLFVVQYILCLNSIILFLVHLLLLKRKVTR